jgi:hypothetical protein
MEQVRESYGAVYQVIKEASVSGYVTAGLRGRMYHAIDTMKTLKAPDDHISVAERISVTLLGLEWATQKRDAARLAKDWQTLGALAEQWLSAPGTQS